LGVLVILVLGVLAQVTVWAPTYISAFLPLLDIAIISVVVYIDSYSALVVNLINIIFTMEPTFASVASMTVTPALQAQIDAAVAALPNAYQVAPYELERAESTKAAFVQLQD
jgi:hypothetical protein